MAKVTVKVDTRELERKLSKLDPQLREVTKKTLPRLIIAFIKKGISPVKGQGRFKKYSNSYRSAIKGETAFWTSKNGKVQSISALTSRELKSYRASKEARKDNKDLKNWIEKHNDLNGKRVSPVNLTVKGDMLKSIRIKDAPRGVRIVFEDEKAQYHNEGTDKIPRRAMLPTESGEIFNNSIMLRLREVVARVIKNNLG